MIVTVFMLLAIAAFIVTIVHAIGKCPLWPGVLILAVIELLRALPLGH